MGKKRVLVVSIVLVLLCAGSALAFSFAFNISEQYAGKHTGNYYPCWDRHFNLSLGAEYPISSGRVKIGYVTGVCNHHHNFAGGVALFKNDTQVDSWTQRGVCSKCGFTWRAHDFGGKPANIVKICSGDDNGGVQNSRSSERGYPYEITYHTQAETASVVRLDNEISIGTVSSFFDRPFSALRNESGWHIVVTIADPKVMLWVGDSDDKTQTSTADIGAEVWACADTDANKQCDVDQATTCLAGNGDWYKGVCCSASTECTFEAGIAALCGRTATGKYEWAPLAERGDIHEFFGCAENASVVSNGTAFFQCGGTPFLRSVDLGDIRRRNPPPAPYAMMGGFASVMLGPFTHEYFCEGKTITECGGSQAFSTINTHQTGDVRTFNTSSLHYCASDGDWTTDLDSKDEDSCEASGYFWTGARCCSENDDRNEHYNDPLANTSLGRGGCWNKTYVESGRFAIQNKVINYRGKFFGCRLNTTLLLLRDSHTNELLVNNSIGVCGEVLPDAVPGGQYPHAVCNPQGNWEFTDELMGELQKTIKWSALINVSGIKQAGCCAYDQCWNGTKCQAAGAYYRIGERGFACAMPPEQQAPGGG